MKKLYFLKLLFIFNCCFVWTIKGQDCEQQESSTNPEAPVNSLTNHLNYIDWFSNNDLLLDKFPSGTEWLSSPYWLTNPGALTSIIAEQHLSDFRPEDGWEVVKIDLGRLSDNITPRNDANAHNSPYMIFYNRHRGLMRFFMMHRDIGWGPNIIKYKITIPTKDAPQNTVDGLPLDLPPNSLSVSNTLSIQGETMQPLDQKTTELSVQMITDFPATEHSTYWTYFDLPVAYDPCICRKPVMFRISGTVVDKLGLVAKGALTGTIQETSPGVNYDKLVANRVIGGVGALATAIATKGAIIQTSKFTDLIDIITNNPNTHSNDKKNWKLIKSIMNFAGAVGNVSFDKKGNKWKVDSESIDKDKVKAYISGVSKYMSSLSKDLNYGSSKSGATTVMGEMIIEGEIEGEDNLNRIIDIALPGTRWDGLPGYDTSFLQEESGIYTFGSDNYLSPEGPIYNKPIGTFAVLKTPTIELSISQNTTEHKLEVKSYLRDNLKYYFNPNTNINLDNTKIQTRIILYHQFSSSIFLDENFQTKNIDSFNEKKMYSNYVDINDIKELLMELKLESLEDFPYEGDDIFFYGVKKAELQFYIEYESIENGYDGDPIRNVQIFTVPVNIDNDYTTFPYEAINTNTHLKSLIINTSQNYSATEVTYVDGPIKIKAPVETEPGVIKGFFSSTLIDVLPGATIDDKVFIKTGPFQQLEPQPPVSIDYVRSFCDKTNQDAIYNADLYKTKITSTNESGNINEYINSNSENSSFQIYPNPASDSTTLFIKEFDRNKEYKVSIHDMNSNKLNEIRIRSQSTKIDLDKYERGIYFMKLIQGGRTNSIKLIKSK